MKPHDIVTHVFQSYQESGILVRGNDDQTPTSIAAIKAAIKNTTITVPPLVSITSVALPDVPISGTAAAGGNVGNEWVEYLTSPEFGYDSPLTEENFQLIE